MILPCQHAKFPPRGPSEIEARAVIGTPFQRMSTNMTDLLAANYDGPATAYNTIGGVSSNVFAIDNPGLSYLDLAIFGNAASAGENKIKVYGVIDIPGAKRTGATVAIEKQFDPGITYVNTLGAIIVPLFDPDTGDHEITFSATADIIDTEVPYYFTSSNNYVYCAGVDRVYALVTSGTGLDGSAGNLVLMGRFVG